MTKNLLEILLAVCIPVAGSVGYMHGTFATKSSVEKNTNKIIRVDRLICKMAISQNIKNAENICTDNN